MINKRIKILRAKFNKYNIDGYIVPKNDEFFSEYAVKDRLKTISNFSGSAGLAVIMKKKSFLFIDGRYTIQAKQQSGNQFKIIESHKFLPKNIIKNIRLGFDPSLFTNSKMKKTELTRLKELCEKLEIVPDYVLLFSKSGFTNEVKALKSDGVKLFTVKSLKAILGA